MADQDDYNKKTKPTDEEKLDDVVSSFGKSTLKEDVKGIGEGDVSDDGESETNENSSPDNAESDLIDEEELKELEDKFTEEEKEVPLELQSSSSDLKMLTAVPEKLLSSRMNQCRSKAKAMISTRRRDEAQTLKAKGNELFKSGNYLESAESYTLGLRLCPLKFSKERAIMYANRAAAKMKLERYETALEDCSKAVELDGSYVKAWTRRAQIHEKLDKLDEALEDYKKVLVMDPHHAEAGDAIRRLPEQIKERNEKLKEEMLDKLKDLGNMILRPFGLSTNNFQMTKDPNSGGYSVNFKNNPN